MPDCCTFAPAFCAVSRLRVWLTMCLLSWVLIGPGRAANGQSPYGVEPPRTADAALAGLSGAADLIVTDGHPGVGPEAERGVASATAAGGSAGAGNPPKSGEAVMVQVEVQAAPDAATEMGDPAVHVTAEAMEKAAGTLGDPMRYFQTVAGVQTDSDQRNDLLVRGGNPSENLFVIDGIEVPSVNQLALSDTTGGLVSMVDGEAIESMTLHAGAHDAAFSDRLSSVVEISTVGREAGRSRRRVAEAGIGGAGGMMSWVLGKRGGMQGDTGRGTLLVSERQSVLSLFTHDVGIGGVPVYNNALARGDWTVGPRDRVWGMSLTGIDSIAIRPSTEDLGGTNPVDVNYSGWRNTTGANWQHGFSAKSFGVLTMWNSEQAQSVVEQQPLVAIEPTYTEETHDGSTSAKVEFTSQRRTWLMLSGGGIETIRRVDYRLAQPLPLPSPYSAWTTSADVARIATAFQVPEEAGFAQATLHAADSLRTLRGTRLTLGGRATHWNFDGQTRLTPKAFLSVPLGGTRSAGVGYAEYAQMPAFLYLLAFPGNHALTPIKAQHFTFDLANVVRTSHMGLNLAAYEKRYVDYPVAQQYPQLSLANIADTFGESFLLFPMVSKGRGRTDGAEASFSLRAGGRFTAQVNMAYARSWFSGLDGVMRRGNFDVPLAGNTSAVWRIGRGVTLAARYSASSGKVFTPDNFALTDAQNRDVFDLTMVNRARSAPYSRLDFRFERSHALRGGVLTWHAGLQNALNHRNFYGVEWRPEIKGQYELDQMPTFPEAGAKWVF